MLSSAAPSDRRPDLKPQYSNLFDAPSDRRPDLKPQNSNLSDAPSVRRPDLKSQISNHSKRAGKKCVSDGPSSRRPVLKLNNSKQYQSPWAVKHHTKVSVEKPDSLSVLIIEQGTPKETLSSQDPLKAQTPVLCEVNSILPDVETPPQNNSPFWIDSPQQPLPSNDNLKGKIQVAQIAYSLTPKLQHTTPEQPPRFGPTSDDSVQIATPSPSTGSMYFSKKLKRWVQVSNQDLRKCDTLETGSQIIVTAQQEPQSSHISLPGIARLGRSNQEEDDIQVNKSRS